MNKMTTGIKLFLGVMLLAAVAQAAGPQPMYTSESIYTSSYTCSAGSLQTVWISSPYPVSLYSIKVSSAGTGGATVRLFDGVTSTSTAKLIDGINGTINGQHYYNISFSSFMGIDNQSIGGFPACIDIIYKRR